MVSQPTEQRNGETDSPSEILQRNGHVNSPQDWGKEPSKRYDRKKGKKGDGKKGDGKKERQSVDVSLRDLKHHPLARRGRKEKISAYY